MQVLKFGGTSVASADAMLQTIQIVQKALEADRTLVVSSAISGCTDALIEMGRLAAARDEAYKERLSRWQERHHAIIDKLLPAGYRNKTQGAVDGLFGQLESILQGVFLLGELSPTSLSAVESFGELFSTRILTDSFLSQGIACRWLDAREIVRVRDGVVESAETYRRVQEAVEQHTRAELFIVPGFIARDQDGKVTTLGRGGSDYTASLFAVGIHARRVEIWTDVPGIMTAHPEVVPSARPIPHISYRAAQELSHFGAKVIYPPTIQPVVAEGIPIYVKDTFHPDEPGTLVEKNPPRAQGGEIRRGRKGAPSALPTPMAWRSSRWKGAAWWAFRASARACSTPFLAPASTSSSSRRPRPCTPCALPLPRPTPRKPGGRPMPASPTKFPSGN